MKYTISINQKQALESGIKDVNRLFILDVLSVASLWCETVIIKDVVYYWVARQKIIDELPILNLKSDTVYRHLKELKKSGFIEYLKQGKKDIIRLTKKAKSLFVTMSEVNPNHYVGSKSELNGKNSEVNPTYKSTNTYKNTKIREGAQENALSPEEIKFKKRIGQKQFDLLKADPNHFHNIPNEKKVLFAEWLQHRKEIKKPCGTMRVIKKQFSYFLKNPTNVCKQAVKIATESGTKGWVDIGYGFEKVPKAQVPNTFSDGTKYVRPAQGGLNNF